MTKKIELTRDLEALVDDSEYDFLTAHSWYAHPDGKGQMYAATRIMDKIVYMHDFLMDVDDGTKVDHINNNSLDNQKENLRKATDQENARNKSKQEGTSSGYKGVTKVKNRWKASMSIDNKDIHIGYYDTEKEAADAYDKATKKEFGEFANPNKP